MTKTATLLASAIAIASLFSPTTAHNDTAQTLTEEDIQLFNEFYNVNNNRMVKAGDHDFILDNHDLGPGWPEPGNESFAIMQALASGGGEEDRKGRSNFPDLVQPISIINFYKADGTGKRTYGEFQAQIDMLNSAYSGADARRGRYGSATDTNIQFKLAGVRYVQNDDYFNYCTLPSTIAKVRPRYMMDGAVHLNVYVCWCQNNLGLSWLPYDSWFRQKTGEDHYALGAIVHHELLPGNNFNKGLWNQGKILVHEIGHAYGLKHPYEGDCDGSESNSDMIADTPRMKGNPLESCQKLGRRDSCRQSGVDDLSTYMIATGDSCRDHFTPGQVSFMQNTIRQYKPTLMKQLPPACVAAVDSTDGSPDLQPCLDGTVQTANNGRQWCKTDPDDNDVWAWACCPSSGKNFDKDGCRQGTPNFNAPRNPGSPPKSRRAGKLRK